MLFEAGGIWGIRGWEALTTLPSLLHADAMS